MKKISYKWKRAFIRWKVALQSTWHNLKLDYKGLEVDLYDLNKKVEPHIRYVNIFLLVLVTLSLIFSLGFSGAARLKHINEYLEIVLLGMFTVIYLTRLTLTSRKFAFVCTRYLETLLFVIAVALFVALVFTDLDKKSPLSFLFGETTNYGLLLTGIKIGLGIFILAKFIRIIPILLSARQHPGKILAGSFTVLIFVGSVLLMLPEATVDGKGLSLIDALFTSTSAVCVTGLIVVDTATHFTLMGQMVILILIQLGGIGIITFATFFALFVSGGIGMGQMAYLREIVQEHNVTQTIKTLKRIVGLTLFIEFVGAAGYYWAWSEMFPAGDKRLFYAVFHAVSAFCNAGFALFTNSLADIGNALNVSVNVITVMLIISGGLGFTTIWEMIRVKKRSIHRYSLHVKLVGIVTLSLILIGTFGILLTEWNAGLRNYSFGYKLLLSFFQSVTTRTAGFNTIDIGTLGMGTTMIVMALMAIGASPASTGGGLKTTTFGVLVLTARSVLRGDTQVEFARKIIPSDVIFKAFTSLFIAGGCILLGTTILAITEHIPFTDLLFEEISAFSTVGLSRGITSDLTGSGKTVIICSMFLGRLGSLTLLAAFIGKQKKRNYAYPRESVMVS